MSFNDSLNFTPTTESLEKLDSSFHILLSGYLRESKTFELYDSIFETNQIRAMLLPFELSLLNNEKCAHSFNFDGKRMLFFGCGGVSSAIAITLSNTLNRIGLVDLHRELTDRLKSLIHQLNPAMQVEKFDTTSLHNLANFDVFYNGTGLGKGMNANLTIEASPLKLDAILPKTGAAFDANYVPEKPLFSKQLEPLGFKVFNGLSHMLASTAIHVSLVRGVDITYRSVESIYIIENYLRSTSTREKIYGLVI